MKHRSKDDDSNRLRGFGVVSSHAGIALATFWVLLFLGAQLPTPLQGILFAPQSSASAQPKLGAPINAPINAPRVNSPAPKTAPQPKASAHQPIEDPKRSLEYFARALERDGLTRVLHLGDSQIDLDHISGEMRTRLQARHGDGGHGYLPVIRPWRWYRQPGIGYTSEKGSWRRHRLGGGKNPDGRLGLSMLAAESEGRAWSRIALGEKKKADRLALSYLAGPGRGKVELYANDERVVVVDTAAEKHQARLATVRIARGTQKLRVVARGRTRLFGLILERQTKRGVVWDNLPAISGRFHQLIWLDAKHFEEQLELRRPAMVVFQFGANDAISYGESIETYGKRVRAALSRVQAFKDISCLVVSPLDQRARYKGRLQPSRNLDRVLDSQRAAARTEGCAFWDARAAMGGPGSIVRWRAEGLTRPDFVHLNKKGAAKLASLLDDALRASLRRFK